jgi:hypothetical protein
VQMEDKVRRVAMFSFLFCLAKTFSVCEILKRIT